MDFLTSYWVLDIVLIFLILIFIAYVYMTRNFKYWLAKGVPETRPTPFVGNFGDCILMRRTPGQLFKQLYDQNNDSEYIGCYLFDQPFLLPRDPAIIKDILIKDFDWFVDRYSAASENDTLGTANLFLLKSPHWKNLRYKLTPVFSSGKIKKMFYLMAAAADDLDTHLEALELDGNGGVIELIEICARYSTDVVGSCAFGLKVNSLNNPNAEFRTFGRKVYAFTYRRSVEFMAFFFAPRLVKPMGFKFFESSCSNFLRKVFWETINARIESGERKNDLMDTLIELRNAQAQTDVDDPEVFKFDGDNLVAQAAVFFIAAFETTATTMAFSMYELALQPNIQQRLRNEITSALEENEGKLNYEMVMNLPYLDMVVSETLRKYPPLPFLDRVATRDYKVSGTDLVIEKGTPVFISVLGLHYDPLYFPDPERYDPERFNDENRQKRLSCVYMPFGEGPHNCLGLRFGLLEVKLGLIKILSKYEVTKCDRTLIPMRLDPKAVNIAPQGGLYLRLRKITSIDG